MARASGADCIDHNVGLGGGVLPWLEILVGAADKARGGNTLPILLEVGVQVGPNPRRTDVFGSIIVAD